MIEKISELDQMFTTLDSYGIPLPRWLCVLIIVVILLGVFIYFVDIIISRLWKLIKFVNSYFYNADTKNLIEVRNSFVGHLEHEVEKLNRDSEWDDSLHYTELEAEVEVGQYITTHLFQSKNPIRILNDLVYLIKNLRIKSSEKIEKNLTQAIIRSKSQAFIIIGDPGSGKTVSLRHLFLEMAKKVKRSKRIDEIIPIYLNLKKLNIEPDKISPDKIRDWIIDQLVTGKDRTVREFIDNNFKKMLKEGRFFFLFDSFDEIPSVMDAQEENEIIHKYSEAIDGFLHAESKRRGLISSRPYRSPKKLDAQKMTILPLSNKRIKKALKNYLRQDSLTNKIWNELVRREDLVSVIRNPFYLALLTQYCKESESLPERHYDLFEHFVQNRAKTDEDRLSHLGFTPKELMQHAEILAFAMTKTSNIGLETNTNQIREITNDFDRTSGWDSSKIEALISALTYSKLGRKSEEDVDKPASFSFVHRRFHEYFCARYLKKEYQSAPFETLNSDNRWREILVLLCEVLPVELLDKIFEISLKSLKEGNSANLGSKEHKKALETILFLKDAFKSRISEVPNDIRVECSNFVKKQFQDKNHLNQKRALEALIIADADSSYSIIESAFEQNSRYLNETAFRSCRILERIPKKISVAIRKSFFHKYVKMEIHKQHEYYSVLFSSTSVLKPLNVFLKILLSSTVLQILFIVAFLSFLIKSDPRNVSSFLYGTIFFLTIYSFISLANYKGGHELTNPKTDFRIKYVPSGILSKEKLSVVSEYINNLSLFISSLFLNPFCCYSIVMLLFFGVLPNQNQIYLFWFTPIILTFLLYTMIYFENISTIFSFIIDIIKDLLNNFKLKSVPKYLLYIALIWILISIFPILLIIVLPVAMTKTTIFDPINKILTHWKENHKFDLASFKELFTSVFFYVVTIALIITFIAMSSNGNMINANDLGISYIFETLYSNYNYELATIVTLLDILLVLTIFIQIIRFIYSLLSPFIYYLIDQLALYKLSKKVKKSAMSTAEALNGLNLLKTEGARDQYIQILKKDLTIEGDPQIIIEEATKRKGRVNDSLFQLAEMWEDSIDRKY